MTLIDIQLSLHAETRMQRLRRGSEDIALTLQHGEHTQGEEEGTREAYVELDGKALTVVYDATRYEDENLFYIVTILRRRSRQ